jgi:hypothetical protein
MALLSYVKIARDKRLLISESRDDLNWCTPCMGKPDQYNMYASHASPRTTRVCFLRVVLVRGNLSRWPNKVGQIHCSWKSAPDSTSQPGWVARGTCLNFSPNITIEVVCLSRTSIDEQATRHTGSISSAYDQYIQYLLTRANPSVLNRHRRGL